MTILDEGPYTVFTADPATFSGVMPMALRGSIAGNSSGNTVVKVDYTNQPDPTYGNIRSCATTADGLFHSTPGKKIYFGWSEGAQGGIEWLRTYGPTSTIDPSELIFVLIGNPERRIGAIPFGTPQQLGLAAPPANTPYTVYDFCRQYDGWADYPEDQTNIISVANAWMGMMFVHINYFERTLDDTDIVWYQSGNYHFGWGPTYPVPLVTSSSPIPAILGLQTPTLPTAISTIIKSLDENLRPKVESGYTLTGRNIPNPDYADLLEYHRELVSPHANKLVNIEGLHNRMHNVRKLYAGRRDLPHPASLPHAA